MPPSKTIHLWIIIRSTLLISEKLVAFDVFYNLLGGWRLSHCPTTLPLVWFGDFMLKVTLKPCMTCLK